MNLKLTVIGVLVCLCTILILQNVAPVEVTFLFWSKSLSRALLVFFTLLIGFVLGWFLHGYFSYRRTKRRGRLTDDNAFIRKE